MSLSISGKRATIPVSTSYPTRKSLQNGGRPEEILSPEHECTESRTATIAKIRNHVLRIDEHLEFQREYLASNNPEKVLEKYSHLFVA